MIIPATYSSHRILASGLVAIGALLFLQGNASATLIGGWDFQTTTAGGTAVAAAPSTPAVLLANDGVQAGAATIYANGTNGSSTFVTATTGNEVTSFGGSNLNTSGTLLSTTTTGTASLALLNSTANAKAITITFSMLGFQNLVLTYATQRTTSGFTGNQWSYSLDGTTFTNLGTAIVPASTFAVVTLPTLNALDNAPGTVFLKYTLAGATTSTGNNRLDNVQINADPVPEPSTAVALLGGVGVLCGFRRIRNRRVSSL